MSKNWRNKRKASQVAPKPAALPVNDGGFYLDVPNKERSSAVSSAKLTVSAHTFRGPTPPPEILREYAELYPDAPRIIFESFERQGIHRREMEARYMRHAVMRSYLGLLSGTVICLACLGLGGGLLCIQDRI